jgi:hypothetical protein
LSKEEKQQWLANKIKISKQEMDETEEANKSEEVNSKPRDAGSEPLDFEDSQDNNNGPTVKVEGIK